MTKFSVDRLPAGFFNLAQDVSRSLPLDLIERWTQSDRSVQTALKLLDPVQIECAVVCTDSAGLTHLTRLRGLIEILGMINHPKELVHAWGTAAGGTAVGVWAADNTEMLYPRSTPPETVLSMLLSLMGDIGSTCEVWIGAAVHWGRFFLLADGLYGEEANRVEHLAEELAGPGEVLITAEFASRLPEGHPFTLSPKHVVSHLGPTYLLEGGPFANELTPRDFAYPVPYSAEFYADLKRFWGGPAGRQQLEALRHRYCQTLAVVLIEREREESDVAEIAVLNDLALSAAMGHFAADLLRDSGGSVAKITGALGIFTFRDCAAAIEFARRFREAFLAQGIRTRIGIDVGDVLMFELGSGLVDVAGMPVNVASKLAQDAGEFGKIYLTEAASQSCASRDGLTLLKFQFGEVNVDAWVE